MGEAATESETKAVSNCNILMNATKCHQRQRWADKLRVDPESATPPLLFALNVGNWYY